MKRIKYTLFSLMALAFVSCTEDIFDKKDSLTSFNQITVGMADLATTRTHLGDNNAMLWDKGNSIGVYSDTQDVEIYTLNQSDGGNASFTGNTVKGSKFYAFYPYSQDAVDTSNKNLLHIQLYNGWVKEKESSLPMVAISTTNSFMFKQVVGAIKISLTGKNKVTSITLKGNKGEVIAGKGTIDLSAETPLLKLDGDSQMTSSLIPCDVDLKSDSPSVFYFPVPVMTLESGITIEIRGKKAGTGEEFFLEKKSNESITITRATIKNFSGLDTDAILKQEDDQKILERQALIDLYNATDGAHWTNNQNWGSDKPLKEWHGVFTDDQGYVTTLDLGDNNLTGNFPESVCSLINLKYLGLSGNNLTGEIPESIGNLKKLEKLWLRVNQLSGSIPESIGELTELTELTMDCNQLTGQIPESLSNLKKIKILWLHYNQLSGSIPEWLGNLIELKDLRLVYNNLTGSIPVSLSNLVNLEELMISGNRLTGEISQELINSDMWKTCNPILFQQDGYGLTYNLYTSTDFSKDGNVVVLQKHSKGNGIKLVIMGEAFSDRLINDGTYEETMKKAMDYFFGIEPYTSFRDYFDVYYVVVVSENELLGESTGLHITEDGGFFSSNDEYIRPYVLKVNELNNSLSDVTSIVILHSNFSCRVHTAMFEDGFSIALSSSRDGLGPDGGFAVDMMSDIRHEAGGHGFGLLADEYYEADETGNRVYPQDEWALLDEEHQRGKLLNIDYHSNPSEVVWKDFISNHDYDIEKIGVYEGAAAYCTYGIYRPTDYSIMHGTNPYNEEFNAPSRWAIYQRIMKLAGEDYSFESFLEYDKKNLAAIAAKATTRNYVEKPVASKTQLGAPPVFYNYPSSEIGKH